MSTGVLARWSAAKGWLVLPVWAAVTVVVALAPDWGFSPASTRQLVLICFLCLLVSGLNLSYGFAGELSFASPAFYALGAYTTVMVSLHWHNDIALCMAVGAVAGLLLGLLSGIPGLRLGGWMLAVSSFFLILLVPNVVSIAQRWTGGYEGATGIPLPSLLGSSLDFNEYLVVVVVATSGWLILFRNLVRSRSGDILSVLRESPILAASLGISVYGTKLKAYAISGVPATVAGTLFAYLDGYVAPITFGLTLAITVLAGSILGGSRSVLGAVVGATLLQLGPNSSTSLGKYALVFYGGFLIFMAIVLPRGAAGLATSVTDRVPRLLGRTGAKPVRQEDPKERAQLPTITGQRLTIEGVSKSFGGNAALSDVSFVAEPGEIVALIGPNGSGKTTLLNTISGYYRVDRGTVMLGERKISGLGPSRVARAGVGRTFQTPLVAPLTVRQNVAVARTRTSRVSILETMLRLPRFWTTKRGDVKAVEGIISAVGLEPWADEQAQALPLGTRRILELARALASQPAVLLLDEVASGLDKEEVEQLSRMVREVAAAG
ncbi:MAG TPA: ATP-binding cassette domain-containing protein, partial [Nocardioides sp.]|uniref:branched-chain amino acid ABC transporter ATP-binding protein/permease n=1 Tax=Nocardioides sp. TaxID=35761 RepID=UPI002E330F5D